MAKKIRTVRQKEIAKELNLSVGTVSKAFSNYTDINEKTRAKVINAASKMGYEFDTRSKKALSGKSYFVGVLIYGFSDDWQHTTYFAGMSERCAKMNVSLVLHYVNAADCEKILEPDHQPPALREGQLSGLILVNRWPRHIVRKLLKELPAVSVVHKIPDVSLDVVGIDDTGGMSMLMDHLYQLGHRRIGFFGRCGEITWSRKRFAAYADSLCRLGLDLDIESVCDVSAELIEDKSLDWDRQIDYAAVQFRRGVRAWMCASDRAGYMLCRGLMDRGIRVPHDVSITGFDNSETDRLGCRELTSVTVPALKIGAEALRRLITRLRHPTGPYLHVELPCKFVEGLTTAAPSADYTASAKSID